MKHIRAKNGLKPDHLVRMQYSQVRSLPVKKEEGEHRYGNKSCYGPGLFDMEKFFPYGNKQKQETAAGELQTPMYHYRLQSHEKRHEA